MTVRALVCVSALAMWTVAAACTSEPAPVGGSGGQGQAGGGGGSPATGSGGSPATGSGGSTPGSGGSAQGGAGGATVDAAPAGTGGSDSGAGGTPGDGGAGNDGLPVLSDAAMASEGCGKPPGQMLNQAVRKTVMAANMEREFFVRLPTGYDPMRAYRTIFLGPGCGSKGQQVLPMQNAAGPNAIIVGMSPVGTCFVTNNASSPEIPFFDEALKFVSTNYCVDKSRVFVAGFSSGSWWTNLLSCARSGVIRGQGNAAGGMPGISPCSTVPVAGLLAHDQNDNDNAISGSMRARDRLIALNGCSQETQPYDWDGNPQTPSTCVIYQGCKPGYPVVWCPTTGKGHSDQVPLTTTGLWRFWSEF